MSDEEPSRGQQIYELAQEGLSWDKITELMGGNKKAVYSCYDRWCKSHDVKKVNLKSFTGQGNQPPICYWFNCRNRIKPNQRRILILTTTNGAQLTGSRRIASMHVKCFEKMNSLMRGLRAKTK